MYLNLAIVSPWTNFTKYNLGYIYDDSCSSVYAPNYIYIDYKAAVSLATTHPFTNKLLNMDITRWNYINDYIP